MFLQRDVWNLYCKNPHCIKILTIYPTTQLHANTKPYQNFFRNFVSYTPLTEFAGDNSKVMRYGKLEILQNSYSI